MRGVSDAEVEIALDIGAQHAEGPNWDARSDRLWWVDIVGEHVHRFDPASGHDDAWPTPGQPGGVIVQADGAAVIQAPDGLRVLSESDATTRLVAQIEADRPENRGNDLKVDSRGRVWAGTMPFDKRPRHAALYRVERDEATAVVTGLTISNGPALDEHNGRMYVADTALGIVDVFDFDITTGSIDARRRFVDVSADGWWPDGMTVDAEGALWVALGRAGRVRRYRTDGSIDGEIGLPTTHPTSVTFGGSDGGDLYITTSWFDVPAADRASEQHAGAIFRCRPGVSGPAAHRWPG